MTRCWSATARRRGRDLPIEGRDLDGVHFAMDFLPRQGTASRRPPLDNHPILAGGNIVVITGGGNSTGLEDIGTSIRQGALSSRGSRRSCPGRLRDENKALTWPGNR